MYTCSIYIYVFVKCVSEVLKMPWQRSTFHPSADASRALAVGSSRKQCVKHGQAKAVQTLHQTWSNQLHLCAPDQTQRRCPTQSSFQTQSQRRHCCFLQFDPRQRFSLGKGLPKIVAWRPGHCCSWICHNSSALPGLWPSWQPSIQALEHHF